MADIFVCMYVPACECGVHVAVRGQPGESAVAWRVALSLPPIALQEHGDHSQVLHPTPCGSGHVIFRKLVQHTLYLLSIL